MCADLFNLFEEIHGLAHGRALVGGDREEYAETVLKISALATRGMASIRKPEATRIPSTITLKSGNSFNLADIAHISSVAVITLSGRWEYFQFTVTLCGPKPVVVTLKSENVQSLTPFDRHSQTTFEEAIKKQRAVAQATINIDHEELTRAWHNYHSR